MSDTYATLKTTQGDIVIHLFDNHAPKTVQNFVGLAEGTQDYSVPGSDKKSPAPFYDGLGFHRVIENFMIQGGCPLGTGTGGPATSSRTSSTPSSRSTGRTCSRWRTPGRARTAPSSS